MVKHQVDTLGQDESSCNHPFYFNLTPTGAVAVMGNLTQQLNQMAIPFSFKVLYNPKDYHRYDSEILYFEKSHYNRIRQVMTALYNVLPLKFSFTTHFDLT
ncbi:MAG: T3SS effector HopA1 family protein [Nostoc sp.]|uniref:T3SS effector HopA1 family protein n=1 Tax=Nostoc sp. TaxID=1180 RepID=UPI002FFA9C40